MDYYCFTTQTGTVSDYFDLEKYSDSREKHFYSEAQESIMLAKQKGQLLLFDLRTQQFIDGNGCLVDIRGKEIFPRCKIYDSEQLLASIENNGGNSIVTRANYQAVENWFDYITVQREIIRSTFGEVQDNLDFYEERFGNRIFLKTIKKQFSNICTIISFGDSKVLLSMVGRSLFGGDFLISDKSTPVLVTEALSIMRDVHGKREWRVFVVKGKILSISRASDEDVNVESYVIEKIKEKVEQISEVRNFPTSYCVDFFEYEKNGEVIFDICEFNSIQSSGLYKNNKLVF